MNEYSVAIACALGLNPKRPDRERQSGTYVPVERDGEGREYLLRILPAHNPLATRKLRADLRNQVRTTQGRPFSQVVDSGWCAQVGRLWALYDIDEAESLADVAAISHALTCLAQVAFDLSTTEEGHGSLTPDEIYLPKNGLPPSVLPPVAPEDSRRLGGREITEQLLFNPPISLRNDREDIFEFDPTVSPGKRDRFAIAAMAALYLGAPTPTVDQIVDEESTLGEIWISMLPEKTSLALRAALSRGLTEPQTGSHALRELAEALRDSPEAELSIARRQEFEAAGWHLRHDPNDQVPGSFDDFKLDSEQLDPRTSARPSPTMEASASDQFDSDALLPDDISARAIHAVLDQRVIGQQIAKRQLSVLLSMHLSWFRSPDRKHKAPNAVAIGPTGVGKTHTLRVGAEYLRIPFVVVDATSLVPAGIVGLQVEDILEELVSEADQILKDSGSARKNGDAIRLAERGVILIDEFDKIRRESDQRDEFGKEQVQRRLLKLTEGTTMPVGVSRHGFQTARQHMDTSGILFIASGAFDGVSSQKIRNNRPTALQRAMTKLDEVIAADLISYGFLPELIARLQTILQFHALEVPQLLEILDNPATSPMAVWENHFSRLRRRLEFTHDARQAVAEHAALLGLGARGLQQVLFPLLAAAAFDFEDSEIQVLVLDRERVKEGINIK